MESPIVAIIALLLLSLLLALGLSPGVTALQPRKIPRPLAIALFYLVITAIIGGLFVTTGRIIASESAGFLSLVSDWMAQWETITAENTLLAPPQSLQNVLPAGSIRVAGIGLTMVTAVLLILLITYYLLVEGELLWARALVLFPP